MPTYTGKVTNTAGAILTGAFIGHTPECRRNCNRPIASARSDGQGNFSIDLDGEVYAHEFLCRMDGYEPQRRVVDVSSTGGYIEFVLVPAPVPVPAVPVPAPAAPAPAPVPAAPAPNPAPEPGAEDGEGANLQPGDLSIATAHLCGARCKTKPTPCANRTRNKGYCHLHA